MDLINLVQNKDCKFDSRWLSKEDLLAINLPKSNARGYSTIVREMPNVLFVVAEVLRTMVNDNIDTYRVILFYPTIAPTTLLIPAGKRRLISSSPAGKLFLFEGGKKEIGPIEIHVNDLL